jgi:O-antigen/teichoic acid export membrane protein
MNTTNPLHPTGVRKCIAGATCAAAQPLLLNAIGIPVTAYIVRSLGPSAYGQFAVAVSLTATFSFLTSLGLRGAFVRAVARHPESAPGATAEQLALRILLGGVAAAFMLLIAAGLGYDPTILWCTVVAAVGLIFTTIASVTADLFQGLQRLPVLAAVNLIAGLVLTAASVVAVLLGAGPVGLSVAYLLGPLTATGVSLALVGRWHFPVRLHWDARRFRDLICGSRHFTAQRAILVLDSNVEALLLPRLVGLAPFGLFSVGTMLVDRLQIVPDGLGSAFYTAMSQGQNKGHEFVSREAARYLSLMVLVCTPAIVLTYSAARLIASILFPDQAETCRWIICLTIWALPLAGVDHMMAQALNAAGKDAAQARLALAAGVCNPVMAVVLISRWGLAGACWSYVLRSGVRALFRAPCFVRTFCRVPSRLQLGRIFACNALMAALMWGARPLISVWLAPHPLAVGPGRWLSAFLALAVEAGTGALAYAGALVVFRVIDPADLTHYLRLRQRFSG